MNTDAGHDPGVERRALSLKPGPEPGFWRWGLAGEGSADSGTVAARGREDAVVAVLAEVYDDLVGRGRQEIAVTLQEGARIWGLVDELAEHFAGVAVVPYTPADAGLRDAAMRALDPALTSPATPSTALPADLAPLVVATDGAARRGRIGWGWLAEDGRHACGSTVPGDRECARRALPHMAELRAVAAAIAGNPGRRLVIHTDSQLTVALVREWARGGRRLPDGYDGTHRNAASKTGLVGIQDLVRREARRVEIRWVRGHTGDPLNEGADSLAKLARRAHEGGWGFDQGDVPARAASIAETFAGRGTLSPAA